MKATGIIRRLDDLGRIVIPRDVRRQLHFREGDPLELFIEKNGVLFKKYSHPSTTFSTSCGMQCVKRKEFRIAQNCLCVSRNWESSSKSPSSLEVKKMREQRSSPDRNMQEYFDFLEKLRDSGVTNMYGATPYLQKQFPELRHDFKRAVNILHSWFDTFKTGRKEE